jgi:lipopolysaccharide/colanic/teichoic acid biosynthesis glycosyltransferase
MAVESTVRASAASWHLTRRGWIALDWGLSAGAILLAYALQPRFVFGWATSNPAQPGAFQAALLYPWFILVSMHIAGLHDPLSDRRRWFVLLRVMLAVFVALGFYLLALYFVSLQQIGRAILIRTLVLSIVLIGGARIALCFLPPKSLARFKTLIGRNHLPFGLVVAEVDEAGRTPGDLAGFFIRQGVEEIIVAAREVQHEVWLACLNCGVQVTDMAVFVEREYYKVSCDDVDLAWFLHFDLKWNHPFYYRFKRVLDKVAAGAGLLLSLPIVLIAALAIMIESGRPVFYSQTRVGFRGRLYRMWKLRTMSRDAERAGAQWSTQGDVRITKVGRILRKTRIDEIPQFWNVFQGEMSLVGPRPERPEFVEKLAAVIPLYPQRHWVTPGITGWAQINYPYGASVEDAREKLCYDLYYLKNASLLLDLHIALRTVGAVARGSR